MKYCFAARYAPGRSCRAPALAAVALVAALAPALTSSAQQTSSLGVVAIVGATVIDGTGAAPRPDTTLVINGARIARIVSAGAAVVPAGARVIDGRGKYLLPGFIDAHIHYRDFYPELLITHGITSVADWGGSPIDWVLAQRDGVEKGRLYGPRIFTGGETIGDADIDVKGAVDAVRRLAARGVNKIDLGFNVPPDAVRAAVAEAHRLGLPIAGYPVSAREAVDAGIDALKHTYIVGAANVDDAGAEELRRESRLPERRRDARKFLLGAEHDDLARRMVAHRVAWVPTLAKDFKVIHDKRDVFELEGYRLLAHPGLSYLPTLNFFVQLANEYEAGIPVVASGLVGTTDRSGPEYERYRAAYRNLQRLMRTIVQQGGRVLAGTAPHSFVLPGLSLHQEMELFVDAGFTPQQALLSASRWVAEFLRVDRDLGTIESGKLADLVLLAGNPLEDIRQTRRVETVVQGGRVLPTGYHSTYVNPIPRNTTRNAPGAGYPTPRLDTIEPSVLVEAGEDATVTLHGRAFAPAAVAYADQVPLPTTVVSDGELRAVVPASIRRRVGTYWLRVINPRPGGGASEPVSLIVKFQ